MELDKNDPFQTVVNDFFSASTSTLSFHFYLEIKTLNSNQVETEKNPSRNVKLYFSHWHWIYHSTIKHHKREKRSKTCTFSSALSLLSRCWLSFVVIVKSIHMFTSILSWVCEISLALSYGSGATTISCPIFFLFVFLSILLATKRSEYTRAGLNRL